MDEKVVRNQRCRIPCPAVKEFEDLNNKNMNKENVKYLINRANAFLEAMRLIYEIESRDKSKYSKNNAFSSHKTYATQLTNLAIDVRKEFPKSNFFVYNTKDMKGSFDSLYMYRREVFDGVFIEVGKIKAFLESKLNQKDEEIDKIITLVTKNLEVL